MASTYSFDVTTGCDLQEVDNAVNQAQKEVTQRFDFKGSHVLIDFQRSENLIKLEAEGDMRSDALLDVIRSKLIKRGVSVKNLDITDPKPGSGEILRREIKLKMALDSETAKKVSAAIKEAKLKKVTSSIQGEQVRVSSPDKDALQECMTLLRKGDFGVELQFGNYR
ncbi:MAG: YajQ family cyclic di-GMP-binding protein [Gemmatimonadaceae bacterium]|jgi:cyclic-di-GMP-binding protein|nr:YajQ family cyclic di-GMP-binding protein [Gemmatimonadaceae bacterium]